MGVLERFWLWRRASPRAAEPGEPEGKGADIIQWRHKAQNDDYVPSGRVFAKGSMVEISDRKAAVRSELQARLYLYDNRMLIVCSVSGISEIGEPSVLPLDVSDEDFGRCVCDHLLRFKPKSPENMRNHKLSDWSAYRASRAKSVRRFEEKSWMVRVVTINTAISIFTSPRNSLWREIHAHGYASPMHEKLGSTIRRTLRAAAVLRENGIV
jgi:hypothetical protein